MKGMQKIKRGDNFKGVLEYAFDRQKNEEKTPGHIIGGNMAGTNTRELTREFLRFCDARPDVEKPVWHNSLRLPEGEHLTDEKWNEIGFDYVKRLGFNEDLNQFVFIKHDDPEGEHIHIIGSRVDMLGNLYLGKNENVISTRVISELEHDHHLTITKNLDYIQDEQGNYYIAERSPGRGRLLSRAEEKMQDRKQWNEDIDYLAPKQRLANAIESALTNQPTTEAFINSLEAENIKVMCVVKQGQMVGFSFEIDGENFKGSQVGANWKELTNPKERKLDYEQERDAEIIGSRKYAASRKPVAGTESTIESDSKPASKSTKQPRKQRAVADTRPPERNSQGRFISSKEPELELGIDSGFPGMVPSSIELEHRNDSLERVSERSNTSGSIKAENTTTETQETSIAVDSNDAFESRFNPTRMADIPDYQRAGRPIGIGAAIADQSSINLAQADRTSSEQAVVNVLFDDVEEGATVVKTVGALKLMPKNVIAKAQSVGSTLAEVATPETKELVQAGTAYVESLAEDNLAGRLLAKADEFDRKNSNAKANSEKHLAENLLAKADEFDKEKEEKAKGTWKSKDDLEDVK